MNPRPITQSLLLAALLGCGTVVFADAPNPDGYLLDSAGQAVRSGFGLCWRTSRWTPAMATEECDPELVKKAPPPAPAPAPEAAVPPPPRPAAEKVTLNADTLFDFDKATLRPAGKEKLDELAGEFANMNVEVIIAVGYTDRIGSDKYNLKLSQRRADSVKAYLVGKGIPANRIEAEGKGKKDPVTAGKCDHMGKENRSNKKLIACLQPDRRVEIQVLGTRQAK